MLEFFKLDLTQSLIKLEYICLQKGIPLYLIEELKSDSNDFYKVIILKENGKFKKVIIDSKDEIWISGVLARSWNTDETMYVYDMLKETLDLIPFTKIEPEKDLDSILDKINKWGANSLLEEEF